MYSLQYLWSTLCSWFYPLLCSYRCYDTHRMSNIKVCQRLSNKLHGYLWANGCFLWGFFVGDKSSSFLERHTSCWAASLLPGQLLVQVRCVCVDIRVCTDGKLRATDCQCSSPARLNKMATKQNNLHQFPFAFNKDSGIRDGKRSEGTLTIPTRNASLNFKGQLG